MDIETNYKRLMWIPNHGGFVAPYEGQDISDFLSNDEFCDYLNALEAQVAQLRAALEMVNTLSGNHAIQDVVRAALAASDLERAP